MTEKRCGTCKHAVAMKRHAPQLECDAPLPESLDGYSYDRMSPDDGKTCKVWEKRDD